MAGHRGSPRVTLQHRVVEVVRCAPLRVAHTPKLAVSRRSCIGERLDRAGAETIFALPQFPLGVGLCLLYESRVRDDRHVPSWDAVRP